MKYWLAWFILLFHVSATAQLTWTTSGDVAPDTCSNMHPRLCLDGAGNPLVVWGRMNDQTVFFSRWTGSAFSAPVILNPPWMPVATASWMGPDIASHGDTVYVVVKRIPESADSNRIFLFASFNGGVSFSNPVELGFIADSISRFPAVTTDATGNPIVAFMKFNSSFLDSRWAVLRSSDYGNTFTTDTKASGWGGSAEVCDCCPGEIISEGNTCVVLYRDNNANLRDSWAGISADNAISFTNGCAVDDNNWVIAACPASGPDGVIVGDTLYATFMSGGTGSYQAYLSKTCLGSNTLCSIEPLTGNIPGLSQQNYPRIANDGSAIAIVWKQSVNGDAQLPILLTPDITNGFPASYDTVAVNNVTNADVKLKNSRVWVVWQDNASGTVRYKTGTYSAPTGLREEFDTNPFSVFPNPAGEELNVASDLSSVFTIRVYTVLGKLVYQETVQGKTTVSLTDWSEGLYLMALEAGDRVYRKKFFKH